MFKFKFTDDKINLFFQSYVHNNQNKDIVHFIKLFFKRNFFKSKTKSLQKKKEKELQKSLHKIRISQLLFLLEKNKNKQLSLKCEYKEICNKYNKLQKISKLNNNETIKNNLEKDLTLNNTIIYL